MWNKLILITLVFLFAASVNAEMERVQVGDMIQVNLPGEETLNKGFQVDKRGRINLPEVGALYVAGYTENQLQQSVLNALSKVYRDLSTASVYISEQQVLISIQGVRKLSRRIHFIEKCRCSNGNSRCWWITFRCAVK
mgnify:CR=1 FL=1